MMSTKRLIPGGLFFLLLLCVLFSTGCKTVVRDRTLPASIRSVYVPMIINRSSEPGLEEGLTVAFQKEVLADGRLDLVKEKRADAIVKITVQDFDNHTFNFDNDRFATSQVYDLYATMIIVENIPGQPMIGGVRKLRISRPYNADPRRTGYEPEARQKDSLYTSFGRTAVLEMITGAFEDPNAPSDQAPQDPSRIPNIQFAQ